MAIVGRPLDKMVTTDHIGAPTGGLYGDIRRWEPALNRAGLKLAWSLIWHAFFVYTVRPGTNNCVPQLPLFESRTGDPIPVDRKLVDTLIYLREQNARDDKTMLRQEFERRVSAKKAAEEAAEDEDRKYKLKDIMKEASRVIGQETRPAFLDLGRN
jgi:hypothetical protein